MGDLLKKKKDPPPEMQIQADLIAAALVREFRAAALGIGWALSPGLFFGFMFLGAMLSICAGFAWLFLGVII